MIRRPELAALMLERINAKGLNEYRLDVEDMTTLINTILKEITYSVSEGRVVSIRGFGTFKVKVYKGNTKAKIYTQYCQEGEVGKELYFARPTFKAGSILKNQV